MTRLLRTLLSLVCVVVVAMTAGCSATGKFKYVGEPPDWDMELPAPDDAGTEPGTMRIRLHCATMEDDDVFADELGAAVVEQMRKAGMGDVKLLRDRSKKPQFEIVVYEAGEDGKFDFNEEAGIWTGVGTGVATGILTESVGAGVLGGVAGAGVGGLVFGEKKEVYAFAGVCRQRTALSAVKSTTDSRDTDNTTGGGIRDRDTGTSVRQGDDRAVLERTHWSYETKARERPFMFHITVSGGSMSSKSARDAAAREAFIKRFPKFATGGTVIG